MSFLIGWFDEGLDLGLIVGPVWVCGKGELGCEYGEFGCG